MKITIKNQLILLLFTAFISGFIGIFIWLFLKLLSVGTGIIWEWLPQQISFTGYPIAICLIGGLLLGFFQKKYGKWPQDLKTVMGIIHKQGYYSYDHVFMMAVAAILPLLFGGSIGPEAGLTGVIAGLCFWAGDNFKYAGNHVREMTKVGVTATLGAIFHAPLFGFFLPIEEDLDRNDVEQLPKPMKILLYLVAAVCGFWVFSVLSKLFGGGLGMPRLSGSKVSGTDWGWILVFILAGILCGVIFEQSGHMLQKIYQPCSTGNRIFLATMSGALVLGLAGTWSPLVLFSGEEQMEVLAEEYLTYTPWMLLAIGLVKLVLTNICIESGWRGGHFFPVIFAGVSIGYGVALLTGTEPVYAAAMITATILGFTMKKPIAVVMLLMLCFPMSYIVGIAVAAFAGAFVGKIPAHKKKGEGDESIAV